MTFLGIDWETLHKQRAPLKVEILELEDEEKPEKLPKDLKNILEDDEPGQPIRGPNKQKIKHQDFDQTRLDLLHELNLKVYESYM